MVRRSDTPRKFVPGLVHEVLHVVVQAERPDTKAHSSEIADEERLGVCGAVVPPSRSRAVVVVCVSSIGAEGIEPSLP